jgi:hypothetical protein
MLESIFLAKTKTREILRFYLSVLRFYSVLLQISYT